MTAGTVDATFWEDLVPRLAQTCTFVWDTVVCLGSLQEHVPYTSLTTTYDSRGLTKITNRGHRQALRFYNRAIMNVRQLTERDEIDDSVVVLSYILFASVEFQQRNVRTGNDLVERCCKILSGDLSALYFRQEPIGGQAVHQVVTPFVLRRGVLVATLGNGLPPLWAANNEVGNMLKAVLSRSLALNDARVQFHSLVYHCYDLIRLADFIPNIKDDDPDMVLFLSQRQSLLYKLMQWKTSFNATRCLTPDLGTDWIGSYLLMYWAVCYISLAACVSLRQTNFDKYMDYFAEIIEHATICLAHSAQFTNAQLVSNVDTGVIPPLYFCATKCRDPILRREALRLMRQAPQQETSWAFVAPERVAAKVISVEEGGNHPHSPEDFPELQYVGMPPEERRFAYVSIVSRQASGGRQRQALELSRFHFATDGSTRLINEYTWLDDEEELGPDPQHGSLCMGPRHM